MLVGPSTYTIGCVSAQTVLDFSPHRTREPRRFDLCTLGRAGMLAFGLHGAECVELPKPLNTPAELVLSVGPCVEAQHVLERHPNDATRFLKCPPTISSGASTNFGGHDGDGWWVTHLNARLSAQR